MATGSGGIPATPLACDFGGVRPPSFECGGMVLSSRRQVASTARACGIVVNKFSLRHSSRSRLLQRSTNAFWAGWASCTGGAAVSGAGPSQCGALPAHAEHRRFVVPAATWVPHAGFGKSAHSTPQIGGCHERQDRNVSQPTRPNRP